MINKFNSSANKQIIRRVWNAPLLEFLTQRFDKKLAYFGLPSPQAEDIHDWIDWIEFIVAFQCREYPKPSDPLQSDEAIRELENNLNTLMRKKKIIDFQLYDGYIEEVVMRGRDNVLQEFNLKEFITLFNLDFCNEITVPQEVYNNSTEKFEKVYKLHVIKRIIDLQRKNNSSPERFVTFLTVNANFWKEEASNYLRHIVVEHKEPDFIKKILKLRGLDRKARVLKHYVYNSLSSFFCSNNYIPEFLPVVLYKGGGNQNLVQFCIICTHETTLGRNSISRQSFNDFLNQCFITPDIKTNQMVPIISKQIDEIKPVLNPIDLITSTKVYNEFWN